MNAYHAVGTQSSNDKYNMESKALEKFNNKGIINYLSIASSQSPLIKKIDM
jgi:hypothetical protein